MHRGRVWRGAKGWPSPRGRAARRARGTRRLLRRLPTRQHDRPLPPLPPPPLAGAWDLSKAPALAWSEGDLWSVQLDLEAGARGEAWVWDQRRLARCCSHPFSPVPNYKYVVMNPQYVVYSQIHTPLFAPLFAGMVYEYKYVVMNPDARTAAAWQSGGNSAIALQWGDGEVEVYDNW